MGSLVLTSSSSVALVQLGNATTANKSACCKASFFSESSFKQASAAGRMHVSLHSHSFFRVKCAHTNCCTPVVETLPDLYGLLGVGSAANAAEIKSSFRKMALRYHPDVCPSAEKEECSRMFIQVQQAYEILSDPGQRADYDYHLMHSTASCAARGLHHRMSCGDSREAWKSNWEAQLESLRQRRRRGGVESWGARMRKTHSCC